MQVARAFARLVSVAAEEDAIGEQQLKRIDAIKGRQLCTESCALPDCSHIAG